MVVKSWEFCIKERLLPHSSSLIEAISITMTVNFVARVDIVTSALWVAMAMQLFKRALEVIIEMFLSSC